MQSSREFGHQRLRVFSGPLRALRPFYRKRDPLQGNIPVRGKLVVQLVDDGPAHDTIELDSPRAGAREGHEHGERVEVLSRKAAS